MRILMKKLNHLNGVRFFIKNDFEIMLNSFHKASSKNNNRAGCYSLLRVIFPLIDHMGQLRLGEVGNHSIAMKQYIIDYMGKVKSGYQNCAGLLVKIYRHGLVHKSQPNRIKHKNSIVEWDLYYRENYCCHLICKKEGKRKRRFYFNIEQFAKDFVQSVGIYEKELKNNKTLKINYNRALKEMSKPIDSSRLKDKWLDKKDFLILN